MFGVFCTYSEIVCCSYCFPLEVYGKHDMYAAQQHAKIYILKEREREGERQKERILSKPIAKNHPDEQYIGENKENKQHWKIK